MHSGNAGIRGRTLLACVLAMNVGSVSSAEESHSAIMGTMLSPATDTGADRLYGLTYVTGTRLSKELVREFSFMAAKGGLDPAAGDATFLALGVDFGFLGAAPGDRPMFILGGGLQQTRSDLGDSGHGPYLNAGLALTAPAFSDAASGLRSEVRYHRVLGDHAGLRGGGYWRLNIGADFGGTAAPAPAAPPAPPADTDGDGVPDAADACPDTPAGTVVNATGCAAVAEVDSDNDGVMDGADRCPDTAAGVEVDETGCARIEKVVLTGVTFGPGSSKLQPGATAILQSVASAMKSNTALRVEIGGHTDSLGRADLNLALSKKRAEAVRSFLIAEGIGADRLVATGHGDKQPVASNATAEGRAENRRVGFRILSE